MQWKPVFIATSKHWVCNFTISLFSKKKIVNDFER